MNIEFPSPDRTPPSSPPSSPRAPNSPKISQVATKAIKYCPPAPKRKAPLRANYIETNPEKIAMNEFARLASDIRTHQRLSLPDGELQLKPFGNGAHGCVFEIVTELPELVPGIPNKEIIIKVPKEDENCALWYKYTMQQYTQLILCNISCVEILNPQPVRLSGYIATRRMDREFDAMNPDDREQLIEILRACYAYDIPADIHNGWNANDDHPELSGNLMVKGDRLCIMDFMERDEETDIILRKCLPTYFRKNHPYGVEIDHLNPEIVDVQWDQTTDVGSFTDLKQFFREISLKKSFLKGEYFDRDFDLPLEQLQKKLDEVREEFNNKLAQYKLPLHTLRGLLFLKSELRAFPTEYSKIRTPDGSVHQLISTERNEFIRLVFNGNKAVENFLLLS